MIRESRRCWIWPSRRFCRRLHLLQVSLFRKVRIILATLSCAVLAGCSGIKPLGRVGNLEFTSVHSSRFFGPNFNSLVVSNAATSEVRIEQVFGGPGIGSATIAGAAHIGASAVLGTSLDQSSEAVIVHGTPSRRQAISRLAAPKDGDKDRDPIKKPKGGQGNSDDH